MRGGWGRRGGRQQQGGGGARPRVIVQDRGLENPGGRLLGLQGWPVGLGEEEGVRWPGGPRGGLGAAVDPVAYDDVVAEAAHRCHGGALLPLDHRCHPALGYQPADPSQGVFPGAQLWRLSWTNQSRDGTLLRSQEEQLILGGSATSSGNIMHVS